MEEDFMKNEKILKYIYMSDEKFRLVFQLILWIRRKSDNIKKDRNK